VRGEHGQCALELAAGKHDRAFCKFLISRGADPWSGSHLGESLLGYFDSEGAAQLVAAAVAAGIPHPDDDPWRTLSFDRMPRGASFEPVKDLELELDDGERVAAQWPADARFVMQGSKKEHELHDVMPVGFRNMLVSESVAALLRDEPSVELLPVTLLDHGKKPRSERYYFLNAIAIDCLIAERCHPDWRASDSDVMNQVAAMVIDASRVGAAQIFRPGKLSSPPTVVSRALAEKLAAFESVSIGYLKR
jgi:hypothetical protein